MISTLKMKSYDVSLRTSRVFVGNLIEDLFEVFVSSWEIEIHVFLHSSLVSLHVPTNYSANVALRRLVD